jgi:hypothetical protein
MKRSEMIAELRTLIHCQQKVGFEDPKIVAERILKLIENSGMLPPQLPESKWDAIGEEHGYNTWREYQLDFGVQDDDLELFDWEKENE